MGRVRSYRERLAFEMRSVRMKSVVVLMERALRSEFARSPLEAEVLARASIGWLPGLGLGVVPGLVRLGVPLTRSRRHSASRRGVALITAVEALEDTWAWQAWGLSGVQRARVVRWLLEVRRQGGWASLSEVAAWANMTPKALAHRLLPLRDRGVWLPHVGGGDETPEALGVVAWLLERYLAGGSVDDELVACGVTPGLWEAWLAGAVLVRDAGDAPAEVVAARIGWSAFEVMQVRLVLVRQRRSVAGLLPPAGAVLPSVSADVAATRSQVRSQLVSRYAFSALGADLYLEWLLALVQRLQAAPAREGEVVVFAIAASESARAELAEAQLVPVRLSFFTDSDAALGPKSAVRTRVSEMKFARIERFARQARAQGALLTLPDLAEDGTRLQLEREAPVMEELWAQFGPGAAGVGWDIGLMSLARHIGDPDAYPRPPEEDPKWTGSGESKDFYRTASDAWGRASIDASTPPDGAAAAAERTRAFYSGESAGEASAAP